MRAVAAAATVAAAALFAGCGGSATSEPMAAEVKSDGAALESFTAYASGLKVADTKVGGGASAKPGQICVMHYTGWLYQNGQKGAKFDSSLDRGKPFEFALGRGQVIKGWDEGVAGMKVGGKRTLVIPPDLGYGGAPRSGIPAFSTLMFEVELLAVKR
ncbi:MAG: FKBP-type peptidyl-prolyl cis-trans isomerase [Hyphomicrobiaceae bacterium]|nr:FKBP-type peptidyl-prolyl cis-trans isomerase [Hyphomicrobiaceae bacterium]